MPSAAARAFVLSNPVQSRTARRSELDVMTFEKITGSLENLPKVARTWAAFYAAVLLLGFDKVIAPMGCIIDAHRRSGGISSSERSAYRAHAELERAGLIRRASCRLKDVSKGSVVHISRERFAFMYPLHLHMPKRQTLACTKDQSRSVDPQSVVFKTSSCYVESRAKGIEGIGAASAGADVGHKAEGIGAAHAVADVGHRIAKNGENPKKPETTCKTHAKEKAIRRWHPLVYTLGIIARAQGGIEHGTVMQARAARELVPGGELEIWANGDRWLDMSIQEREHEARDIHKRLLKMYGGTEKRMYGNFKKINSESNPIGFLKFGDEHKIRNKTGEAQAIGEFFIQNGERTFKNDKRGRIFDNGIQRIERKYGTGDSGTGNESRWDAVPDEIKAQIEAIKNWKV